MRCRTRVGLLLPVSLLAVVSAAGQTDPPSSFDLRNVGGHNYVTAVKNQQGGTCWTHGAMAAIEGNLLMTGVWAAAGEYGEPDLAEYHLDWWNNFNQHNNDDTDPPTGGGLEVHYGGDYRVTSAYLARGEGAVRDVDGQSYDLPPLRNSPDFHHYYVRDIEWYTAGADLSRIDLIKTKVMSAGVMGTCMCYDESFLWNYIHYQPPSNGLLANHAIAIVGWDDNKTTQAPQKGAWLCKNSWGPAWGFSGFFWISYYDKYCGQDPQMGAVSFQNVEPLAYQHIYAWDTHGWRDTKTDCTAAFNAFTTTSDQLLKAVSFFVAADNVSYTVTIYDRFEGGQLLDERATQSGVIAYTGFHTLDLATPVRLPPGDDFYIYVSLSSGGQPCDRSSEVPVLLGSSARVWVESVAAAGQSYYWDGAAWQDLHDFNSTANFCIKGLTVDYVPLTISFPSGRPEFLAPGVIARFTVSIADQMENYVPGSGTLDYRYDGGDFHALPLTPTGGSTYQATLPAADCAAQPEYYVSALGDGGTYAVSPPGAPVAAWTAIVGALATTFADDFQTDRGWSVQNLNLISGAWERGVPAGDGTRGDPPTDYDGSGACYVTGNCLGDCDVDGGPTRLLSPLFDLSDGRYYQISYARWFYNDNHDADRLTVQISNNGGANWVTVEEVPHVGAYWVYRTFNVSDFVTRTAQIKVQFSVADIPNNSITEAGIDDFSISALVCSPPNLGDLNCDGTTNFGDINPFVLALTNPAAYASAYPSCDILNADINGDGSVSFGDINPFVTLLTQ
jgi:hypothetical protein